MDYVPEESKFNAFLAAADCGVQLRHPTLGETSGVVSKLFANGERLILSDTLYTSPYAQYNNVIRVKPDKDEVENLVKCFQKIIEQPRLSPIFNRDYLPEICVSQWVDIILA